ncbi:MAG: DUF1190 domain-containing protein [Methylobacteriaceae bacterium]|nr:DUF1190 domain-containing protein [Methylobacteriaceae bacterium]
MASGQEGKPPATPPQGKKGFGKAKPPSPPPPAAKASKRSTAVTLLALGAGAVTIYAATRGSSDYELEQNEKTLLFTNASECSTSGKVPALDCDTAWREAQKAHESHAPRFSSQQTCESEFGPGRCGSPNSFSAAGVFIPLMAGYALAQASNGYRAQALYQRLGDAPGQYRVSGFVQPPPPQQQQSSSSSSSGGSRSWSSSSSSSSWSRSSGPSVSSTGSQTAISRGGFGSTSSAFSSSGSRSSSS